MKIDAAQARKKAIKYQLRNLYKEIQNEVKSGHQKLLLYGENFVLFPENIDKLLKDGYSINLTITTNKISIYSISWEYSRNKEEGEFIKFDCNKLIPSTTTFYIFPGYSPDFSNDNIQEDDNDDENNKDSE